MTKSDTVDSVTDSIVDADEGTRPDLDDPGNYIHRELSMLEFFERVLQMAAEPGVPLLERLRFLTICSTIVDEFFEIRVAGLKERGLPIVGRGRISVGTLV